MYKILGGDGREYGPVSAAQLRQWVIEGRANALTQVKAEGATQWQSLSSLPELSAVFGAGSSTPPALGALPVGGAPGEVHTGDYELDISGCLSRAWTLLTNNLWLLVGGCAVYLLIMGGLAGFARLPLIGLLFSVASLIITGPLVGGVYHFSLRVLRGQPSEVGDVFAGFRDNFGQLLLAYIVPGIITFFVALPGIIVAAVPTILMVKNDAPSAGLIVLAAFGLLLALIPALYLSISWFFTIPLVMDRRLEFWPAMKASRAQVGRHWWTVLGLIIVLGVVNCVGVLLCCVGLFFATPLYFIALACAYETLFLPRTTQPGPGA